MSLGINRDDIESIFDSLERLILSLPRDVILLLIVDGLRSFSQPSNRRREMHEAMVCIVDIYHKRPQVVLKILFTNPSRTDPLRTLLSDDEILPIPRDLPSRGGHGGSRWKAKIDFGM
ncbi:hypothetical protein F4677DRAFT_367823 [Hypoxylon crocopeplum]|nr:hypothetical protein F4677DRAFT_367823 [Hypoxylon crocopeplum]